jgi:hypothetical protein
VDGGDARKSDIADDMMYSIDILRRLEEIWIRGYKRNQGSDSWLLDEMNAYRDAAAAVLFAEYTETMKYGVFNHVRSRGEQYRSFARVFSTQNI